MRTWQSVLLFAVGALVALRLLGFSTLVVEGRSMGEGVPIGSLAFARHLPASEVAVGDVILVQNHAAAMPYIHRVIGLEGGAALTKGDANAEPDPLPYRLPERVLVVAFALPLLGYVLGAPKVLAAIVLLVAAPALLLARWRGRRQVEA